MSIDWTTIRPGRPVACVGAPVPSPPPDWAVVRLFGGRPTEEGRGLLSAIHLRGRQELLTEAGLVGFVADRFRGGLRRRLLGEDLMLDPAWAAMEPLQHLAHHRAGKAALVVDAVEQGDDPSLVKLRQIVAEADRLEFVVVLGFDAVPTSGAAAGLFAVMERFGVVDGGVAAAAEPPPGPEPIPAPPPSPAPAGAEGAPEAEGSARDLVERLLQAAEEAEAVGEVEFAWVRGLEALGETHALPADEARILQGRIRTCLGRVQASGLGAGPQFSLPMALEQLDEAVACLDGGPLLLRSEARHALALAAYELGGPAALDHGIEQLVPAVRELTAAGHELTAARLMNDLAALLVRRGDPLRAHALLEDSRRVFAGRADSPVAVVELAETDHLIARLPLHVGARPGEQAVAAERALEHVDRAAEAYAALGLRRQYAHCLETRARLLLKLGRDADAARALAEALPLQEALEDGLGLARTRAARAELWVARGQPEAALDELTESVRMNVLKGSQGGMAANLAALGRLEASTPAALRPALDEAVGELRDALESRLDGR